MSKFTGGKWTYDTPSGCVHCEGKLIADVAGAGGANYQHDKGQANARLIAAAPEMYRLLSYFSTLEDVTNDEFYNFFVAVNDTRKLVARIDGEEGNHD